MTEPGELDAAASVEDLERTLHSPSYAPTIGATRHVRNVAAQHLLADPSLSARLATALMNALERNAAPEEAVAIGWRCRAEAELYSGHPLDARRSYERAVESATRAGADRERGQILVGLLIVLNTLGERERAAAVATRAERILKRVKDRAYLGKLYLAQGNSFYEAERYGDAHREYRSAHRILRSEGTVGATWAILLMNLGVASMYLGRIDESGRYLRDSEAHATDHGLDLLCAHARFNRAFLERLRGDYRAALHLLESAREGFLRHDTGSLPASVDRAMAEIYIDLAMPGDALPLARRARETFDTHGMWLDARISESDEAVILLETGRPQAACERLLELDRAFRSKRMSTRRAVVRLHTARALLVLGRAREARSTAVRARRTFASAGMTEWASRASRLIAQADGAMGRHARAAETLAEAARGHAALPTRERLALAAHAGRLALARGLRRPARERLERARDLLEIQRRLIPGVELRTRALAEHGSVFEGLVELEVNARVPRFDVLLGLVEAGRARAFAERSALGTTPRDDELGALRARLGQLAQQLETAELEGAGDGHTTALRRSVRTMEARVIERERRRQSRESATPDIVGEASMTRISAVLRPNESIISFFVTQTRILAIAFTRAGRGRVRHAHVVLDTDLATVTSLIDRVNFQLESMSLSARRESINLSFRRRAADALLAELFRALMGPLEPYVVAEGRLVLIPHGALHRVPFEALHDGARYVCDRWTITRAASLAHVVQASTRRRSRGGPTVLAGVTSGLANVGEEIASVAGALRERSPHVLLDPTTSVLLASLDSARLVHISTHGTFREDNPLFSRLSTADGALFLGDVMERPSRAELVVLSACQAGRSFTGRGDDLAGLAHGFLAAGARCLVASQWRVHDEATTALMRAFYRRYTGDAHGDAAAALAGAGRDIRREWDHPFYWGGFSVHGR